MTSFISRPILPWESEKHCIGHRTRIVSKEELLITNLFNQSSSYKQQLDELIKDIAKLRERNAALERKAQAFDEIKEYTLDKIELLTTRQEFASNSNEFERFGNLLTAFKAVKYKIIDLEREE